MSDVTIPADVAREAAAVIRSLSLHPDDPARRLPDLLDPKPPTLRDEAIAEAKVAHRLPGDCATNITDAVLAVVKARIEALPYGPYTVASSDGRWSHGVLCRTDVLALFGDES